jgi:LysM repeat protein
VFLNRAYFAARIASTALLLLLAGCFRPAGDSIEPTTGVVLPLESPAAQPTQPLTLDSTEEANAPRSTIQVTLPSITLVMPETDEALSAESTLAQATAFPTLVAATSTPRFITPGSPLGPVTPDTATPTVDGPPTSTPSGLITPTALPGTGGDDCTYMVQSGDNLFRIATERGLTVQDLMEANPDLVGDPPILQVGQLLNLPDCGEGETAQTSPQATSPVATVALNVPAGGEVYVVRAGDTLYTIALSHGVSVQDIINANNLPNPDRLDIGQEIIIPPAS